MKRKKDGIKTTEAGGWVFVGGRRRTVPSVAADDVYRIMQEVRRLGAGKGGPKPKAGGKRR